MQKSCVYFTTYSGQLMPPFYIGSAFLSMIYEGYKGSVSSKKWKTLWNNELKENPHLFHTEIVSIHNSRKEAFIFENALQREENVVDSPLYINEAFAFSKHPNRKNKTWEELYTKETIEKYLIDRKSRRGKKQSETTVQKRIDKVRGQTRTKEEKDLMRASALKRVERGFLPPNHRGTRIVNNGVINKRLKKDEPIPVGFVLGKKKGG